MNVFSPGGGDTIGIGPELRYQSASGIGIGIDFAHPWVSVSESNFAHPWFSVSVSESNLSNSSINSINLIELRLFY